MIDAPRSSGMQLHVTSLPERTPRPRGLRVRRLAGRGRAVVVAGSAPRPSRSLPLSVQGALGVRRLAGTARVSAGAGDARRARRLPRAPRLLDRGLGALRRAATPSMTRSASSASGARCAATRSSAAWGCSATWPSTSRRPAPITAPTPSSSRTASWPARRPTPTPHDGQLWGNPLYDWPALQRRRYRWWVQRLRRTLELFDLVRIDHFRGLVAYWAVPETDRTAAGGRWRRGPGAALFQGRGPRTRAVCRWWPRTSASSHRRSSACATTSGCPG